MRTVNPVGRGRHWREPRREGGAFRAGRRAISRCTISRSTIGRRTLGRRTISRRTLLGRPAGLRQAGLDLFVDGAIRVDLWQQAFPGVDGAVEVASEKRAGAGQGQAFHVVGRKRQQPADQAVGFARKIPVRRGGQEVGPVRQHAGILRRPGAHARPGCRAAGEIPQRRVGVGQCRPALGVVRVGLQVLDQAG